MTDRQMPMVSVILPVYNDTCYLNEAIESLVNQTFQDWECVVVDDGSSEDVESVIKPRQVSDPRICFLNKKTQ